MVASFGSGPRCAPRRTVESTQKVAAPPHAGLARETLTLSVDGVPQEVEVVRQERFLGGTQAYWCCPKCGALRTCTSSLASLRGAAAIGSATGRGGSRPWYLVPLACAVGSGARLVCCRHCRGSRRIGAPPIIDGGSLSSSLRSACFGKCSVIRSARLSVATGGFVVDDNDDRDGVILEERIAGKSVVAIAELYQCTTSEVDAAIDRRLSFALDNNMRLRAIKLDVARLEALMVPFFERATKGDCDVSAVAAGTLCCKLLERRSLLLGLDQPTQSRVDVYQIPSPNAPSSYQKITDVLLSLKYGPTGRPNGGDAPSVAPDDPEPEPK